MAASLDEAVIHLEQMRSELKCAICSKLFNGAVNLPCNHYFCNGCIVEFMEMEQACPTCKVPITREAVRSAPKIDALVNILRGIESSFVLASLSIADTDAHVRTKGKKAERMESAEEERKKNSDASLVKRLHNKKRVQAPEQDELETVEVVEKEPISARESRKKRAKAAEEDVQNAPGLDDFEDFTIGQMLRKPTCDKASRQTCSEKQHEIRNGGVLSPFFWVRDMEEPESPSSTANPVSAEAGIVTAFSDLKDSMDHSLDAEALMDDANKSEAFCCTQCPPSPELQSAEIPNNLIIEDSLQSAGLSMDHDANEQCVDGKSADETTKPNEGRKAGGEKRLSVGQDTTCVFCHSAGHSDIAGDMVFYEGDQLVERRTTPYSMAVHKLCAEWAPNVYFTDEGAVRNLEAEAARGQKLKCGLCGLKGAALGCSLKRCRKSFHYPCAKASANFHWNLNKYTIRCPDHHAGCRSPVKRKEQMKAPATASRNPTAVQTIARPTGVQRGLLVGRWPPGPWYNWVLCASALDTHKKEELAKFAAIAGATSTPSWNHKVTHLIAATNDNGAARRTMKYLQAILEGKWILRAEWISACLSAGHAVDEAEFEVNCDIHGALEGPKNGRFMATSMTPKLFGGLSFYFMSHFPATLKTDLESLVQTGGGVVLHRRPVPLSSSPTGPMGSSLLVIFNDELYSSSDQDQQQQQRRREAESVAEPAGALVLGYSWIVKSAAACKLQEST